MPPLKPRLPGRPQPQGWARLATLSDASLLQALAQAEAAASAPITSIDDMCRAADARDAASWIRAELAEREGVWASE